MSINSTTENIDYKSLYEQSLLVNRANQKINDEQSQQINLLRLQILELQKFIFSGKQEKFKLTQSGAGLRPVSSLLLLPELQHLLH